MAQTTVEANAIVESQTLDDLSTGNILICRIVEKRGDEDRRVGEVASIVCTVEHVIGQDGSDDAGVSNECLGDVCRVEELAQSVVAGSQKSNVIQISELVEKTVLRSDEGCACQQSAQAKCECKNHVLFRAESVSFSEDRASARVVPLLDWAATRPDRAIERKV